MPLDAIPIVAVHGDAPSAQAGLVPDALSGNAPVLLREIAEHLRDAEAAGVTEVALLPPAEFQREVFTDFAEHVIPRFR